MTVRLLRWFTHGVLLVGLVSVAAVEAVAQVPPTAPSLSIMRPPAMPRRPPSIRRPPIPAPVKARTGGGIVVPLRASEAQGAPVEAEVELYSKSYALVIGNDRYGRGWQPLAKAVSDARRVASALERKGFEVTLETDLDAERLERAFKDFFLDKGADPDARLFVWYAGHGHTLDGEGYLVPTDGASPANRRKFLRNALSIRRFGEFVRLAESKHVFTIFDSCFAGTIFNVARSAPPPAITRITTQPVRQFLTSGDAGQEVSDDGTFATLFIEALGRQRRADGNGDGYLTASEVGSFLAYEMSNLTRNQQTPRHGKLRSPRFNKGDFVFALAGAAATTPKPKRELVASTSGASADKESLFWYSIQGSKDPADYRDYLTQFPKGTFAGLAKRRVEELSKQKTAALAPPKQKPAPAAKPVVGTFSKALKPGDTFKDCPKCPEMVLIPAGKFRMGEPSAESHEDERPVHEVNIRYQFAVGKYEVTQAEYEAVMGTNPSEYKEEKHPVENVSWDDAQNFIHRLNSKTGKKYRLLSESEWEYAARAGTKSRFPWGDSASREHANYGREEGGGGFASGRDKWIHTAPVGRFPPNKLGVYDMHGNVSEWVQDCHRHYSDVPRDGSPATYPGDEECVRSRRGGHYYGPPSYMTSAERSYGKSHERYSSLGFRVARSLSK